MTLVPPYGEEALRRPTVRSSTSAASAGRLVTDEAARAPCRTSGTRAPRWRRRAAARPGRRAWWRGRRCASGAAGALPWRTQREIVGTEPEMIAWRSSGSLTPSSWTTSRPRPSAPAALGAADGAAEDLAEEHLVAGGVDQPVERRGGDGRGPRGEHDLGQAERLDRRHQRQRDAQDHRLGEQAEEEQSHHAGQHGEVGDQRAQQRTDGQDADREVGDRVGALGDLGARAAATGSSPAPRTR